MLDGLGNGRAGHSVSLFTVVWRKMFGTPEAAAVYAWLRCPM